ncbi:GDP-fucose protein O-fucosyltransferase 2 [Lutzomyia longipalpis]|uniref:GDP-fucose protein O-fucosyltransferase 2 n=1 Tax=Lutzomyia longipalpis TaxID=7200 RepID=UPI002484273C|nr:GDP-fucose protein O-fucosyltransferase 2 [Lutzomyia longipalpis]
MPIYIRVIAVLGILCLYFHTAHLNNLNCHIIEIFLDAESFQLCGNNDNIKIQEKKTSNENITYILYDVNPVEGFNLRRDCFIRLAVFVKKLKNEPGYENTKLVLPPFSDLYHWRSRHLDQSHIFWNTFFNLESMKRYTDVLDMWEFFNEIQSIHRGLKNLNSITIDEVYKLKHFQEMFKNGVFEDKFEKTRCGMAEGGAQDGFFHYRNITSKRFTCVNFQGSANLLKDLLEKFKPKNTGNPRIILFLNAEVVLHDFWGNDEFWRARRSMRFNDNLVEKANEFRIENFNSTDVLDAVQRPHRWEDEREYRNAIGGDYLCAHLRRADFLYGRERTTPTLRSASIQIKRITKMLGIDQVFLSSDCSRSELMDLLSFMKRLRVYKYLPPTTGDGSNALKDGEIAIIDQIICSNARYFIGTYESTFTYRIYEEREILGFHPRTTFNTFCKNDDLTECEKNSQWPIVY